MNSPLSIQASHCPSKPEDSKEPDELKDKPELVTDMLNR